MEVVTGTVRVLIVDDQEPFRTAARMVVELTEGFEVAGEAGSGEEGVRLVDELRPDLVLMDIKMPGMDGLDATTQIVADHPGARVVVLSTYEAGEFEDRALEAGAIAFISKSDFGPDRLAEVWSGSD
jgi:DNA-binding NarL/FixJ family response regulator